jgi:hypothetical protein
VALTHLPSLALVMQFLHTDCMGIVPLSFYYIIRFVFPSPVYFSVTNYHEHNFLLLMSARHSEIRSELVRFLSGQ